MYQIVSLGVCFGIAVLLVDGSVDMELFAGETSYLGLILGVIAWRVIASVMAASNTARRIRRL